MASEYSEDRISYTKNEDCLIGQIHLLERIAPNLDEQYPHGLISLVSGSTFVNCNFPLPETPAFTCRKSSLAASSVNFLQAILTALRLSTFRCGYLGPERIPALAYLRRSSPYRALSLPGRYCLIEIYFPRVATSGEFWAQERLKRPCACAGSALAACICSRSKFDRGKPICQTLKTTR